MKMILVALLFVLAFVLVGCTDAQRASITSLGSTCTVTFYQDGKVVQTWQSTGKVATGEAGTRYAFRDAATQKYIRVGVANTIVTQN